MMIVDVERAVVEGVILLRMTVGRMFILRARM